MKRPTWWAGVLLAAAIFGGCAKAYTPQALPENHPANPKATPAQASTQSIDDSALEDPLVRGELTPKPKGGMHMDHGGQMKCGAM